MRYQFSFSVEPKQNPYPGCFVAIEGVDGSGKTSQMEPLKDYFEKQGRKVTLAKTPRKTEGILAAINYDLMQGTGVIPKPAYQYLFTADYIIQTEQIIIPALKRGDIVIIDRFHCWSAVAYGLWEVNEKYDLSLGMNMLVAQGLFSPGYQLIVPDITCLLHVGSETALRRVASKHEEREFYEQKDVIEKVAKGYDWLLNEFPDYLVKIDAEKTLPVVTKSVIDQIEKKIK